MKQIAMKPICYSLYNHDMSLSDLSYNNTVIVEGKQIADIIAVNFADRIMIYPDFINPVESHDYFIGRWEAYKLRKSYDWYRDFKALQAEYSPIENVSEIREENRKTNTSGTIATTGSDKITDKQSGSDTLSLKSDGQDKVTDSISGKDTVAEQTSGNDSTEIKEGGSDTLKVVGDTDTQNRGTVSVTTEYGNTDTQTKQNAFSNLDNVATGEIVSDRHTGTDTQSTEDNSGSKVETNQDNTTTYGKTEDTTKTYDKKNDITTEYGKTDTVTTDYGKSEDTTTTYGKKTEAITEYGKTDKTDTETTDEYSVNRHGNIGVTTNQHMINEEIELRYYNLQYAIAIDFMNTISIY